MSAFDWMVLALWGAATVIVAFRAWRRVSRPYAILLVILWTLGQVTGLLRLPHTRSINLWSDFYAALGVLWFCTSGLRQAPTLNDYRFLLVIALFAQVAAHFVFEANSTVPGAWWWCQAELSVLFAAMLALVEWRPRLGDMARDTASAVRRGYAGPRVRDRRGVVASLNAVAYRIGDAALRERRR